MLMKKKILLGIALASLIATGCSNKEDVKLEELNETTASTTAAFTTAKNEESYTEKNSETTTKTTTIDFEYDDIDEQYPIPELMVFDDAYSGYSKEDKEELISLANEYFYSIYDTTNGYNPVGDNVMTVEDYIEDMKGVNCQVNDIYCLNLIFDNDLAGGMFICIDAYFESEYENIEYDRFYLFCDFEFYRTSVDSEWKVDYKDNTSLYYYDEIYVDRDADTNEIICVPKQ